MTTPSSPKRPDDQSDKTTKIACPHCGHGLPEIHGEREAVRCSNCGDRFHVDPQATLTYRTSRLPKAIGRFDVLGLLGSGSFGAVYKARDAKLDRFVAIKIPRAGFYQDAEEEQRFLREARSAARLKHPGIVGVHEIGQEQGIPYFVCDFIDGVTLADHLSGGRPSFRQAAELLAQVADAVDYAHRQKIIHRDIKPSNILIDAAGRPHVTDFGLARRDEGEIVMTQEGQVLGTPAYMAPEQAAGAQQRVDARSDVYSLGVILYELVTGELPFRGNVRMVLHQVLHEEPRPPRRLNDRIPGDLETICLRAIAKERARRYASAAGLADDLRRFLKGEPIRARPVGTSERIGKWIKRRPAIAALLAGIVLVTALGFAGISWQWDRAEQKAKAEGIARTKAEENEKQANTARRQALRESAQLAMQQGLALCEQDEVARGMLWLARGLDRAMEAEATEIQRAIRLNLDAWGRELHPLKGLLPHREFVTTVAFSPDGRKVLASSGDKTLQVWDAATWKPVGAPLQHGDVFWVAVFSPDGNTILTGSGDKTARLWETATGKPIGSPLRHEGIVRAVAFSPDAKTILTGGFDRVARLWETATAKPVGAPLMLDAPYLHAVGFGPDGRTCITVSSSAQLWDTATGKPRGPLVKGNGFQHAAISPDGRTIVTGDLGPTGRLSDMVTGKSIGAPLPHKPWVAAFSPDGKTVVTAGLDSTARLWNAATGEPLGQPMRHHGVVRSVAFSADGNWALTCGDDQTARLWDAASGKPIGAPLPHPFVRAVALSPDRKTVLTGSADKHVRIWEIAGHKDFQFSVRHDYTISVGAFSPDGRSAFTASHYLGDATLRLWDTTTGKPIGKPVPNGGSGAFELFRPLLSPDGRSILTCSPFSNAGPQLWDAATGNPIGQPLKHDEPINLAAFAPDCKTVYTVDKAQSLGKWDATTGKSLGPPMPLQEEVVAFSPDGKVFVSVTKDKKPRLWEAATGKPLGPPLEHPGTMIMNEIMNVFFSPDSGTVLTGGGGMKRLFEVASGNPLGPPFRPTARVFALGPDGRSFVAGHADNTARLWDATTGKPISRPLPHRGPVSAALISPDGMTLLTASEDGTRRLWDATTGKPVGPSLGQWLAFSPNGRTVLMAGDDFTVRLWEVPTAVAADVDRIRLWIEVLTGMELANDDMMYPLDAETWQQRRQRLEELRGPPA